MPLQVYFDHDKMEKIFYNLLSNAFKFTREGGNVQVDVGLKPTSTDHLNQNKFIQISVKDTGIGIHQDRLPHIFDRFYQVDSAATREHEGTGIGLALTKELVQLHHGEISVQSEDDVGTTFSIQLPSWHDLKEISEIHAPAANKEASLQFEMPVETDVDSVPGKDLHDEQIILVVDDHPDVRKYIREHLDSNFEITEAINGQEGLETAIEIIPDLVISDVMMPKMDGYQFCHALKTNEKTSHIPIILLTAKAGEADKLAGLETGADDYLTKPFNSKELQIRVQNLIEQRQKLRARFIREGMLQPRQVAVTSMDDAFLQKLMTTIEENLSDEDFNVDALCQQISMGRRQLQRKIRGLTGQAPADFIRSVRLQRARQMLDQNAGTISEIAYQVGFNNLSYFSRCFREQFGKLPSEFSASPNS